MTSRLSKLAVLAVLAGSLPAAAAAHDRDHEGPPAAVAPAPWAPAPVPPPRGGHDRDGRRWRDGVRRERELASLRAELRELDARRAEFHARNAWRPGQLRRYDRRYFEQRGALERRIHELQLA